MCIRDRAFAVLHIDGQASSLALVLGVHTSATVACLMFGGVIADRLPRIAVLQTAHVVTALTQGIAAVLVIRGQVSVPTLAVIEAVNGAAGAFAKMCIRDSSRPVPWPRPATRSSTGPSTSGSCTTAGPVSYTHLDVYKRQS